MFSKSSTATATRPLREFRSSGWGTWVVVWALTVVVGLVCAPVGQSAESETSDQLQSPTHRQVRTIEPQVDGTLTRLYTIATTPDGNLVAGVDADGGKILLIDSEGTTLQQWSLDLQPTAIAVAPDGTIFAGGSGRLAQLGPAGTVVKTIDSPHVGDLEELKKQATDSIRKSRVGRSAAMGRQITMLKERVESIEEKEEGDRSRLEQAQLKAFQQQLQMLEDMAGPEDGEVSPALLDTMMARTLNVTSMAASEQDLFLCAADPGQGGYSIWRVSRELDADSSELILDGLRGCCGQMDIQCCKGNLVLSENTRFKIGIYDRHGRAQGSFGGRDRTSRGGFGSCCNPMNSMPLEDGSILTAESSIGHIKRFDTDGNLIAYIGKASIGAGCKHCALGYDAKNDLYYMMYQDKNAICVLANTNNTPMTVAEKELQRRTTDFLARAAGKWDVETVDKKSGNALVALFGGGRGGASPHPVASLQVNGNGSAAILEGMYKAYGDQATLELLPVEEEGEANGVPFALAIDQVRFLEGTWEFVSDDQVKLSFQGLAAANFRRDAKAETCGGKDCGKENCENEKCPQHQVTSTLSPTDQAANDGAFPPQLAKPAEIEVAAPAASRPTTLRPPIVVAREARVAPYPPAAIAAKMVYQYKLVGKEELGEDAEASLNRLGGQGWEYCGKLGKKMMFKRQSVSAVRTDAVAKEVR